MEHRLLGRSGLSVPVLSFGTATFGGASEHLRVWGATDVAEATRMIDRCLDAGVTMFDSADAYSDGLAEEILGQAIAGRRNGLLLSTKTVFRMGPGPNDLGASRLRLIAACEASLKRLGTDHIDIWHMHTFDAMTPIEETMRALDDLVTAGKVRYIGCSNYSGWHLMKSLAVADRHGWSRFIANQAYYSLISRDYEWELMPLGLAEGVGGMIWSPLSGGKLSGKITREKPAPEGTRVAVQGANGPQIPDDQFYDIMDVLLDLSKELGRSVSQIALNWVMCRPTVANVVIGARNEAQLADNLGAAEFRLTPEQIARLDKVSERPPAYPYWHQRRPLAVVRNPVPV